MTTYLTSLIMLVNVPRVTNAAEFLVAIGGKKKVDHLIIALEMALAETLGGDPALFASIDSPYLQNLITKVSDETTNASNWPIRIGGVDRNDHVKVALLMQAIVNNA